MQRRTRITLALATAIAALTIGSQSASAGLLVETATDCDTPAVEQPFTRWSDNANYFLAPNGGFENGSAQWQVSRGAVVSDNEPWKVRNAGDSHSMRLSSGGSATSSSICVGLEHPTLRFFARANSSLTGALLSSLRVDVLTETSLGLTVPVPVGLALYHGNWKPSAKTLVVANLLPLLPGEHTPIAIRFTAQGPATWWIDDVYVDPRSRR